MQFHHLQSKRPENKTNDLPIEVGFLPLDIDSVERIKAKPSGERESVLIRPLGEGWQNHSLNQTPNERMIKKRRKPYRALDSGKAEENIWT